MPLLTKIGTVVGELQTKAFEAFLTVPDVTGPRPPLLSEINVIEMSVCLIEDGVYTYITAWTYNGSTWVPGVEVLKNVNVTNVGRGQYDQTTGRLYLTLHAGDSPCISAFTAPGVKEVHEIVLVARYNINVDQEPTRIQFRVENLNKVPREP